MSIIEKVKKGNEKILKKVELIKELKDKTIYIQYIAGMGTNTGRSDYYRILVQGENNIYQLNIYYYISTLIGRYNKKYDAIMIGGCGYNKAQHIAQYIERIFKEYETNIKVIEL